MARVDVIGAAVTEFEAYIRRKGWTQGTFGQNAGVGHGFMDRLREGRVTLAVLQKARRYCEANPPAFAKAAAGKPAREVAR
jgi:hypothetical protein